MSPCLSCYCKVFCCRNNLHLLQGASSSSCFSCVHCWLKFTWSVRYIFHLHLCYVGLMFMLWGKIIKIYAESDIIKQMEIMGELLMRMFMLWGQDCIDHLLPVFQNTWGWILPWWLSHQGQLMHYFVLPISKFVVWNQNKQFLEYRVQAYCAMNYTCPLSFITFCLFHFQYAYEFTQNEISCLS